METMTMAQACGEEPMPGLSFTPGIDFDPFDDDERETVGLAMERDMADQMAALQDENARLRAQLADLTE